ncbi:signal transduction protein with CBS domains [Halorubrum californiense DSM 19288]|uniref:Signal transduction protein with CBS domains n=1 Tax=Halorubrum californiense DSM 19288 TaxID=1227465 RepID=M0ELC8_9EURY|nr:MULTISPECIES: CBS domain-containing protein [Halorubrum]ELZ48566.1 signal transduction protein with CBS domains [Halorubrum californiense DSM 19288]TKX69463.1 CBS domain-containing protein [Halorubrum sp. GN11GM_10-3_MGM]
MNDVPVARIMSTDLTTIERGAAAAEAAQKMRETGVGSLLVVEPDETLAGLITATDFVALVRDNDPKDRTPVEAFMTTDVITVGRDDTVAELAEPTAHGYTHLPVTDGDGRPIGMVSTTDLTAHLSKAR